MFNRPHLSFKHVNAHNNHSWARATALAFPSACWVRLAAVPSCSPTERLQYRHPSLSAYHFLRALDDFHLNPSRLRGSAPSLPEPIVHSYEGGASRRRTDCYCALLLALWEITVHKWKIESGGSWPQFFCGGRRRFGVFSFILIAQPFTHTILHSF